MTRQRVEGLVLFALAVGYWRWAYRVPPYGVSDPVGPSAFPVLLAAALMVAAAMLVFETRDGAGRRRERPGQVGGVFALLGLYALTFEPLGFLLSTLVFLSGTLILFAPAWRGRIPLYAALMTAVLFVLFRWGLGVVLPRGVLSP